MLAIFMTLATTLVASHLVDVRSSTHCPSSQDISKRLRPLLPDRPAQESSSDVATIDVAGTGADTWLRIRLVRDSGAVVGDRPVPMQDDCAEAAATVAAVIAAWETEPMPPAPPSASKPFAPPPPVVPESLSTWRLLVGAGGGIALVGGVAGAGRIEVLGGKRSSRLQGRLGFAGETSRSRSLYSGNVDWQHTTVEAGVLVRTLHPVWPLFLDAGLAFGWATLQGHGFSQNQKQRSLEYGAVVAARFGRIIGRSCVWAEVRAYGWPQGQSASLVGEATTANLPLADVSASVGLSIPLIW
jgi:hypothetical protein